MKLDRRLIVVAVLAAAACSRQADPGAPAAVATPGSAAVAAAPATPPVAAPVAAPGSAAADPWTKPAPVKDPLPHALFWSIEKDGKTTYLLGTIHMGVDAETRLPDIVWKDFDAAPAFAMETDLSDGGSMMESFKRTSGTLHDELGPEYWKKLQDAITPQVAASLDGMKTMVPASLLAMRGLKQTAPMDGNLVERAKRENKQIVYLEPAALQVTLLDKYEDAKALKESLDDKDAVPHMEAFMAAYVAGDETKMLALTDDERKQALEHGYTAAEYDAQMEDMLYKRNASWIDEIDKLTQGGGGFVAVGAAHLMGKRSVLDLLGQRGYKVSRVTP